MIKIAYHSLYNHLLPEGHRFPMLKYELIPEQLLFEGLITSDNLFQPDICSDEIILLTHEKNYLEKIQNQRLTATEQRKIGFPQSPELTIRELLITQGTIDCCQFALQFGVSMNIAGGTHHAFTDHGEGFCLLNDIAVASNYLLKQSFINKIIVIDLDVHQGNGTAKIFENEKRVFTFSMHGDKNYPFKKEKSDLDLALKDGIQDEEYLLLLQENLKLIIHNEKPDFAFFLSGVDILETDKFGKLKITMKGCAKRDEIVFNELKKNRIPVTVVMGGGYTPDIKIILEAHCNTFRTATAVYDY